MAAVTSCWAGVADDLAKLKELSDKAEALDKDQASRAAGTSPPWTSARPLAGWGCGRSTAARSRQVPSAGSGQQHHTQCSPCSLLPAPPAARRGAGRREAQHPASPAGAAGGAGAPHAHEGGHTAGGAGGGQAGGRAGGREGV